jgi:hypothetical protein
MDLRRLPRWTVYPALAVIFGFMILAIPKPSQRGSAGAALVLRSTASPDCEVIRAEGPPRSGEHAPGDLVIATAGASGDPAGWVCTEGGAPGTWKPFGSWSPLGKATHPSH